MRRPSKNKKYIVVALAIFILAGFVFIKIISPTDDPTKLIEKEKKATIKSIEKLAEESPKIDFTRATQTLTENTSPEAVNQNSSTKVPSVTEQVLQTLKIETPPDFSFYDVVMLDVPAYKQEYKNSCEESALRMVLAYYDIPATDMEVVQKVGYQPRGWDYKNNIWDDPYEMFVGSIDSIKTIGYGAFAPALAKAARAYGREAQSYSPVSAQFIAEQIYNGYPVMVWGLFRTPPYMKYSWKTDEGKEIEAYKGEHVRVVVGVVGDRNNPTGFFLNDPLTGAAKVYWSAERLMKHMNIWGNLTNQAVVVK